LKSWKQNALTNLGIVMENMLGGVSHAAWIASFLLEGAV
jgi:hypothetical protein